MEDLHVGARAQADPARVAPAGAAQRRGGAAAEAVAAQKAQLVRELRPGAALTGSRLPAAAPHAAPLTCVRQARAAFSTATEAAGRGREQSDEHGGEHCDPPRRCRSPSRSPFRAPPAVPRVVAEPPSQVRRRALSSSRLSNSFPVWSHWKRSPTLVTTVLSLRDVGGIEAPWVSTALAGTRQPQARRVSLPLTKI